MTYGVSNGHVIDDVTSTLLRVTSSLRELVPFVTVNAASPPQFRWRGTVCRHPPETRRQCPWSVEFQTERFISAYHTTS